MKALLSVFLIANKGTKHKNILQCAVAQQKQTYKLRERKRCIHSLQFVIFITNIFKLELSAAKVWTFSFNLLCRQKVLSEPIPYSACIIQLSDKYVCIMMSGYRAAVWRTLCRILSGELGRHKLETGFPLLKNAWVWIHRKTFLCLWYNKVLFCYFKWTHFLSPSAL